MKKLWVENIALPSVIYQEDSPGENFIDKTNDILVWDKYFNRVGKDYKFVRSIIMQQVFEDCTVSTPYDAWDGYSSDKKEVASYWFVVPKSLRDTVHTIEEQVVNGSVFNGNTTNSTA